MVTKTVTKFSSNVSDPVADLLTRIRNANLAYKDELVAPVSKLSDSVLKILDGLLARVARGGAVLSMLRRPALVTATAPRRGSYAAAGSPPGGPLRPGPDTEPAAYPRPGSLGWLATGAQHVAPLGGVWI